MAYSCFGRNAGIACVDRWARAGGRGLLVGLVHLVDLGIGHVDPVGDVPGDVVVDVLDDDIDSKLLSCLSSTEAPGCAYSTQNPCSWCGRGRTQVVPPNQAILPRCL